MNKFYFLFFAIFIFIIEVLFNINIALAIFNNNVYKRQYTSRNFLNNIFIPHTYIDGNIIPKGVRDLIFTPGGILQNDGTFLFKSQEGVDPNNIPIDYYQRITGTNKNDVVRFKGRFIIDKLDLLGGYNTLKIESYSELMLHPYYPNKVGLDFLNISNFIIEHGVKVQALKAKYSAFDMNITFTSPDSSNPKNDIILEQLSLYGSSEKVKGTININNAKVEVRGKDKAILTNHSETINLKDAKLTKDNEIDIKTISTLTLSQGLSNPSGNNVINMGKYSSIIVSNGILEMGGSNTINMALGSNIKGQLVFRESNVTINILGSDKENFLMDINKININSLILGKGRSNIFIGDYSNFNINYGLATGEGIIDIYVGKGSIFSSKDGIKIFGIGSNSLKLEEQSTLNTDIEFNKSYTYNNNVIINTGNSHVTINGSINGSGNNDIFTLLGEGVLKLNAEPGKGIDRFKYLNLNRSRIEFEKHFRQTTDSKILISLYSDSSKDNAPRLWFSGLSLFDNNNLDITFRGVSKYLSKVDDKYSLILIRNGREGEGYLTKLEDIGINSINFKSALYKLDYVIEKDSDLRLNLVKYRTFKQAVSEQSSNTETDIYIIQMGEYLDKLLEIKNLKDKYYDILDILAMSEVNAIRQTLVGILPLNNVVLFNINKNLSNDFKQLVINKAAYKIVKDDISLWSNISYSKIDLSNIKSVGGARSNSTNYMLGTEYSAYKFLKLGINIGYSKPNITSRDLLYKGKSDQYYYGIYGNINITKNLSSNIIFGYLNSKYNLSRKPINLDVIYSNPEFKQTDLDILLLYKLKLDDFVVSPFLSIGYINSKMFAYIENGFFVRSIDSSHFNEFKTGIGIKALTVLPLEASNVVIPSISLGLNNHFQGVESTKIYTEIGNVPIEFYANQNYGGLTANGIINISYLIKNSITLDFNIGANLNKNSSSYNFGFSANILL